jgi:hypothetical protein
MLVIREVRPILEENFTRQEFGCVQTTQIQSFRLEAIGDHKLPGTVRHPIAHESSSVGWNRENPLFHPTPVCLFYPRQGALRTVFGAMVVPPLTIKKPSTSDDNGTPSTSCVADIKRVFRFIEDERHLIANGLYQDVLNRIRNGPALPTSRNKLRLRKSKSFKDREGQNKDIQEAEAIIASKKDVLENLNVRFYGLVSCLT